MKEIKFRIYFEDEEPFMSEPITLEDLLHGEDIEFRNEDDTLSLPLNDFRFFYKRNQNYKIMQYTGLYDKNGKKIYEGDILQDEFCVYKVVFEDGCFVGIVEKLLKPCGTQKGLCYTLNDILNLISDDTEIIGNIYENPELLERSSNGD